MDGWGERYRVASAYFPSDGVDNGADALNVDCGDVDIGVTVEMCAPRLRLRHGRWIRRKIKDLFLPTWEAFCKGNVVRRDDCRRERIK